MQLQRGYVVVKLAWLMTGNWFDVQQNFSLWTSLKLSLLLLPSLLHTTIAKVNKPWNQTVDGLQLSIIKQRTELSDMTKISPFLILDNRIINQKRAYHIFCALGHILYCGGPLNWCDLMTSSNRLRLNLWFPLF